MKHLFQYTLLALALCLGFTSCHDEEEVIPAPQQLAVNYANLAGHWQLVSFNDTPLEQGTYLYITFERRDPHKFQMYDNLGTMPNLHQQRTGTYMLEDDEKTETTILSGFYDNGVGAWNNDYRVTSLTEQELELTTIGEPAEVQVYSRIEAIPSL